MTLHVTKNAIICHIKWCRTRYAGYFKTPSKIEDFDVFEKFFKELGYKFKTQNGVQHLRKCTYSNNPNFIAYDDALSFFNCTTVKSLPSGLYKPYRWEDKKTSFFKCRFTEDQLFAAVSHKKHEYGIIEHQRTKQGITDFPEYKI